MERLSRLQRLQQRHREIGKILRDAISDDVDDGFDASTNVIHQAAGTPSSSRHPNEPVDDLATGDEYNDDAHAAPTSVRSDSYNDGSSRPPSISNGGGGSFRQGSRVTGAPPDDVHDAPAATVEMSPVAPARGSKVSPVGGSIVATQPDEHVLERQLGRTLVPYKALAAVPHQTHATLRQRYDVASTADAGHNERATTPEEAAPALPPQDAPSETAATVVSTPREGLLISGERADRPPSVLTEELLRSLPLVHSLEIEVARLQKQLDERDSAAASMSKKIEALARNLVKSLKERNQFEEELLQHLAAHNNNNNNVAQQKSGKHSGLRNDGGAVANTNTTDGSNPSSDTGMFSRAWGGSGSNQLPAPIDHRHLVDELRYKEVELERCYEELNRVAALVHVAERGPRQSNTTTDAAVLEGLQRDVALFTTSLRSVESQRDRLAAELRLSAACIENLDQRLLLSERELLQARLALAASKQAPQADGATPQTPSKNGGLDIVALPLAARMHMARLTAEISALQSQLTQMQLDEQQRASFARDVQEELQHHNASLEEQLTTLMTKLAQEMERHEATRVETERLSTTLKDVHSNTLLVARLIKTSKADVDGVVEAASQRIEHSQHNGVLDIVRPFALQVGRDLSAVSQLIISIRGKLNDIGSDADDAALPVEVQADSANGGGLPKAPRAAAVSPHAGGPPKRRILIAPSESSRQPSQDSTPGWRSTELGWQRHQPPATHSTERSPSPAYPLGRAR